MKGKIAAQIARDAATGKNKDYLKFSSLMCWDAVIECQVMAGRDRPAGVQGNNYQHVIGLGDPAITNADEMRHVPQGAFIGFFSGNTLIHAMIATGAGMAAGNKNKCLEIGSPVGWEILDLANLAGWRNGVATVRGVQVRYRAMD